MATVFKAKGVTFEHWIYPPANFSSLFAQGQNGLAFDFTVKDGLFTNTAATTPVAVSGDVIGYATDGSGNSVPVTAGIAGSRPFWQLDPTPQVSGMYGNGASSMGNTPPTTLMQDDDAATIMLTGLFSTASSSPGDLLALQAITSLGLEKFIQINPAGVQVRRIPGEAMAASQAFMARGERFLLTVRINFALGVMELRKNGKVFQTVTLTSAGKTAAPSTSLSLMGDLGRTAYARGFIHGLFYVNEWVGDDVVSDFEGKLIMDAKLN
jgi:hypothetical protein